MTEDLSNLFEPVAIGPITLPNRIVMAPMTRMFAAGGVLAPTATEYYRRRAAGGTGLILTEGIATSRIAAQTAMVPHLMTPAARSAWRDVVTAVHDAGGRIMAQLWHTGLGRIQPAGFDPDQPSIGPSDTYVADTSPLATQGPSHPPGRAMDRQEIAATINEFAESAAIAEGLGFDGVQLHGAHGYLIDQFLWAETNRRTDDYGGDLAQRTRFATEIIAAIRARTGPGLAIGFRFSQWKLPEFYKIQPMGSPDELKAILLPLADAGVDFFDASTRRFQEPAFPGSALNLAGWAKAVTGKPVMTVGSIGLSKPLDTTMADGTAESDTADLAMLSQMVKRGEVDLVGVGRALIANADWADRVRTGAGGFRPFTAALLGAHD